MKYNTSIGTCSLEEQSSPQFNLQHLNPKCNYCTEHASCLKSLTVDLYIIDIITISDSIMLKL